MNSVMSQNKNQIKNDVSLKNNLSNRIMVYFGLFVIAFRIQNLALAYIILSILVVSITFRLSRSNLYVAGAIVLFFLLYLIFGLNHYERGPEKFVVRVFVIFSYFLFFYGLGIKDKSFKYLNFFCITSVIYVIIVCLYSMNAGYPGYNGVYDIINNNEENSPLYALQLTIFTITYIHLNRKRYNNLILFFLLIPCVYFSVIYLGSRASFVLIVLYFLLNYFNTLKSLFFITLILFFFGSAILVTLEHMDLLAYLDFGGFANRGFDSPRFSMLVYGISNVMYYPTGGLIAQGIGYEGTWFHNMLLDIARVSGYIPMFLWAVILVITVLIAYKKNFHLKIIFVLLNIALLQDLAFDGFFNIMALEFYILGAAYNNLKKVD